MNGDAVGSALRIPRIVIAGVSSHAGKTTAVVAVAAALAARGLKVALFKCGPDYLDPTYHARVCPKGSHNLDGWMMGRDAVLATFARAAEGADIAIIEGVMGLFDGASPSGEEGSTAEIAKWLGAPVVLCVDASGMARSIAAVGLGFASFDPAVSVKGMICNRVGSRSHLDILKKACRTPIVVGGFPKMPELHFPERHLGLRTADENAVPEAHFAAWADLAREWLDLDTFLAMAGLAAPLDVASTDVEAAAPAICRIGIARDEAFHFYYEDNLARLRQSGAELVPFSPIHDPVLPDVDGLYIGGGYPEAHAAELSSNESMIRAIRSFAESGRPVYAECGGMMYMASAIVLLTGERHSMLGIIPGVVEMRDKLVALGYVEVEAQSDSFLGPAGARFRGHQFRYSEFQPDSSVELEHLYRVRRRRGGDVFDEGYRVNNVLASYVHVHWASNPLVAESFVRNCVVGKSKDPVPA